MRGNSVIHLHPVVQGQHVTAFVVCNRCLPVRQSAGHLLQRQRGPVGGTVTLPLRLYWSPPGRVFDLDDPLMLRSMHQVVLGEAIRAEELTGYLNRDMLLGSNRIGRDGTRWLVHGMGVLILFPSQETPASSSKSIGCRRSRNSALAMIA